MTVWLVLSLVVAALLALGAAAVSRHYMPPRTIHRRTPGDLGHSDCHQESDFWPRVLDYLETARGRREAPEGDHGSKSAGAEPGDVGLV